MVAIASVSALRRSDGQIVEKAGIHAQMPRNGCWVKCRDRCEVAPSLRAERSEAKQSRQLHAALDCFGGYAASQ
jgi:hypothetical protein